MVKKGITTIILLFTFLSIVGMVSAVTAPDAEWNRTFGGSGIWNRGISVVQTTDGGLAIIGPALDIGTTTKIGIIKTSINRSIVIRIHDCPYPPCGLPGKIC